MLDEARQYYTEIGGWGAVRSGEWLWAVIEKSFKNYWERATAEYFYLKYPDLSLEKIAGRLISVAAKNAAILGATIGATVSTDEVVGLLTGFEGGVGLPANLTIAGASISSEIILLLRMQLQVGSQSRKALRCGAGPGGSGGHIDDLGICPGDRRCKCGRNGCKRHRRQGSGYRSKEGFLEGGTCGIQAACSESGGKNIAKIHCEVYRADGLYRDREQLELRSNEKGWPYRDGAFQEARRHQLFALTRRQVDQGLAGEKCITVDCSASPPGQVGFGCFRGRR